MDLDTPEAFGELSPAKQEALRMWVRRTLEPTKRIGARQNYSYGLKHDAEQELGWYVSNGQLKGAMLAEGYHWQACEGTPNWVFNCRFRKHGGDDR